MTAVFSVSETCFCTSAALQWAVTEAEGVFDAVKANVYAMIQDLACHMDKVGEFEYRRAAYPQHRSNLPQGLLMSSRTNLCLLSLHAGIAGQPA
jgi:hypothetical protein